MRRIIYRFIFLLWFCFCCTSVFSQSNKIIDSLLYVLKTAREDTVKVNTLLALSHQFWIIANYVQAKLYGDEALLLAEKVVLPDGSQGFKKGIATANIDIGNIYLNQGNYPEALKNYLASLKISEEIGDKQRISICYNNIGNIYMHQGNYPQALKNHLTSLKIKLEIGDKIGISASYNNIGMIYVKQKKYPEALKNHFASLNIDKELGDKSGVAISYSNIGIIYKEQGNYPEALKNYFISLNIDKEIGDKLGIAVDYNNIGDIYYHQGKYSDALDNFWSSLNIGIEIGSKELISINYAQLGDTYTKINNLKKAKECLNKALPIAKELGKKETISDIYNYKQRLDNLLSDYKSAYENYKMYILYRDSLNNKENTEKIISFQMQYEFNKIEDSLKYQQQLTDEELKQQTLLTKQQKQAKNYFIAGLVLFALLSFFVFRNFQNHRKLNKLYKVSAEKQMAEFQLQSLRAQLNPHFMFNSLNAIQELIVMEENEKSQSYLERFAQLLRQLLDNASQPFIPLRKEINFLEHYLSLESLRLPDLQYSITIDPEVIVENITIPNMMLQPYIENALWHGLQHKQGEKKLELHISRQNGSVQFAIKDNGVGRKKAEELKSLYRKEHRSKGMELLSQRFDLLSQEYGQQIQTSITDLAENGVASGTLVEILVPASLSEQEKKNAA